MRAIALLALFVAAASAASVTKDERIIGGSLTTINNYREMAAVLYAANGVSFSQFCGGSILNQRSILTAAHCFDYGRNVPSRWRIRVGSSFASSGGAVHNINRNIIHPNYVQRTFDADLAIMRTVTTIVYTNVVFRADIAGPNYNLPDNSVVWAAGWGVTETGRPSEQLRHVQIWTVNQAVCRQRYPTLTDNMLCSGWLNVGGRDQCQGDSGGPLYHNRVVVGVCSFGNQCALPQFPGVNVRVSRFSNWIVANA